MKKWTDSDLRIAFEDGCKYQNFNDLKTYLIELKNKKKQKKHKTLWKIKLFM